MIREIYFAGGCFWGTEKYFSVIPGVIETNVGYANGNTENPTYEDVCRKNTGYAETVKVLYDSNKISLQALLDMFYEVIDPTTLNKQGPDVGEQYRSGIYFIDDNDQEVIVSSLNNLSKKYIKPIVVEVKKLNNYYLAEEYHQKYLDKTPNGYCHIRKEKIEKAGEFTPQKYNKKTKEELKETLSSTQYRVTQESATESPFQNEYYNHFEEGIYIDITTGEPLFISSDKFESGCGWPSFSKPINKSSIEEIEDKKFGMFRTEVRSKIGNSHLGHVFNDGPSEMGGLRYCINSASLKFIPKKDMEREGYGEYLSLFD